MKLIQGKLKLTLRFVWLVSTSCSIPPPANHQDCHKCSQCEHASIKTSNLRRHVNGTLSFFAVPNLFHVTKQPLSLHSLKEEDNSLCWWTPLSPVSGRRRLKVKLVAVCWSAGGAGVYRYTAEWHSGTQASRPALLGQMPHTDHHPQINRFHRDPRPGRMGSRSTMAL